MVKINIPSRYVRPGENIQKGDIVKIVAEGEYKDGKWGPYFTTQLQIADGSVKEYNPSVQTQVNLKQEYGEDSKSWMNKELKAWVFESIVGGETRTQLVLTPKDWTKPVQDKELPTINESIDVDDVDNINVDEIPF